LALLETPAGFELNSAQVIGRVAEFFRFNLQNYRPQVEIIPARRRGTAFSPDDSQIAAPLLQADMIFLGPGSPSYTVRQLHDSLVWQYLLARHRLGATLALASAAVCAISAFSLPVYEIYKVGEDLHWKPGLDLFGVYNLPLVFIPHWNNNDGGDELDTSRCFMGQARFAQLMDLLPPDLTVIGIDEKTALTMDVEKGICLVSGLGGVTLIHTGHAHGGKPLDLSGTGLKEVARSRRGHVHQYSSGETFPLEECCAFELPQSGDGLPAQVWQQALEAQRGLENQGEAAQETPPLEALALLAERQSARQAKDWAASDALREQLASLGWKVIDSKDGQKLERL
jgi:cyanophycinase-like exopeptidase